MAARADRVSRMPSSLSAPCVDTFAVSRRQFALSLDDPGADGVQRGLLQR
jgi:hypothetical protein